MKTVQQESLQAAFAVVTRVWTKDREKTARILFDVLKDMVIPLNAFELFGLDIYGTWGICQSNISFSDPLSN